MKLFRDDGHQLYAEFQYGGKLGFLESNYYNTMNELNTQTPGTPGNRTPDLTLKENTLNLLATVFAQ